MKSELKELYSRAVKLMDAGKLEQAEAVLSYLSERDRDSPAILAVLGDLYWQMGKLEEAVNAFRAAIELSPKLEAVSLGLFLCLWELGKQVEALDEVKRFQTISDSEDYRRIVKELLES